jgi:DNA-binding NarL/FixJ family response regulator
MRVLLIDDHALFREGLALLMRSRFPQVQLYQAADLAEAAAILGSVAGIAWILLDLGLPDSDGVASLHQLYQLTHAVKVVVLSADDRPETVHNVMAAGANGFIPKTARGRRIEEDLRAIFEGPQGPPIVTDTTGELFGLTVRPAPAVDSALTCMAAQELSHRQLDVLRLLAEGKSNKLIGRELELAESTVKSHLLTIFRKLGVSSRTEAMLLAPRLGLMPSAPGRGAYAGSMPCAVQTCDSVSGWSN